MKFAIKVLGLMLLFSSCNAEVIMRFNKEIHAQASKLGDIIQIKNDRYHWAKIPLHSKPTPGQLLSKETVISWLKEHVGPFQYQWRGRTSIEVKQHIKTSSEDLFNKAKIALNHQLTPRYKIIKIEVLTHPKASEYKLDDFKTEIKNTYPTTKRVCVWLHSKNKHLPVWFKVQAYDRVLIAKKNLHPKDAINSINFSSEIRDISGLKGFPATNFPKNSLLKSSIREHSILLKEQVKLAPLVSKGELIQVTIHQNNITVVMDAIALEEGALGQSIKVQNPKNLESFSVDLTGSHQGELKS